MQTTTPQPLTPKEKVVLEFIEAYFLGQGLAPSFQEIKNHFGFASYNSVQRYLKQLQKKNYISIPGGNQKRAMTLLNSAKAVLSDLKEKQRNLQIAPNANSVEAFSLPLLGRVAAGQPIEAFDHDEFVDIPLSLVRKPSQSFALKVEGQSMIEDGIHDGDTIVVQKQQTANTGDIVIAVVDNEATVKRFYYHQDSSEAPFVSDGPLVELRPANSSMTSMWYHPEQINIRGLVVSLLRTF